MVTLRNFASPCAQSVVLVACDLTVSFVFVLFLAFFLQLSSPSAVISNVLSPRVTRGSLRHLSPDFDWNLLEQSSHFTATEDHALSTADSKGKEKNSAVRFHICLFAISIGFAISRVRSSGNAPKHARRNNSTSARQR